VPAQRRDRAQRHLFAFYCDHCLFLLARLILKGPVTGYDEALQQADIGLSREWF